MVCVITIVRAKVLRARTKTWRGVRRWARGRRRRLRMREPLGDVSLGVLVWWRMRCETTEEDAQEDCVNHGRRRETGHCAGRGIGSVLSLEQ